MKVWGLDEASITTIAKRIDAYPENLRKEGAALAFKLTPTSSDAKYARHTARGRRVKALCHHGFYLWIAYALQAGATRIQSTQLDVADLAGLNKAAPAIASYNAGSIAEPVRFRDLCSFRPGHSWATPMEVQTSAFSADGSLKDTGPILIETCPFYIIDREHYDDHGVCKCAFPEERERMRKEYDYTDEDFKEEGLA